MLLDACTISADETIETDICIVGTGPAGSTLAREFAGQNFRVCQLESGGLEFDEPTQELADGETTGDCMGAPLVTRRRQFGGKANIWDSKVVGHPLTGFRCGPLDEIDFEEKDWLAHSGWPFRKSHLDPFYERAHSVCRLGPYKYHAREWEDAQSPTLPLDGRVMATDVWQFGSQDTFINQYLEEAKRSENITIILFANVIEIETNEAANVVTQVRVARLQGGEFRVAAKIFILATGGMENARLLLLSDRTQKAGLGNQHDLVGRFFMEHQFIHGGTLIPFSRELLNQTALYDARRVNGVPVMGKLHFTDDFLRREQLLNISAVFVPKHKGYRRVRQDSVDSLATLLSAVRRLKVPEQAAAHLGNIISGLDYVFVAGCRKATKQALFPHFTEGPDIQTCIGWSSEPDRGRRYSVFEVILTAEQAPDPENRVTLSDDRDRLGCRKVRLHWRWGDVNVQDVKRAQKILAREFARAGLGRFRIELKDGLPEMIASGLHHHMGTTRMHVDPRQGVVDENCRVHSVANLFIAGCSIFPTGGYINPTLTIIALSLRLADHVKGVIASIPVAEFAASPET